MTYTDMPNDICVLVLSERQRFKWTIRKYTVRDQIAGPIGGYRIDFNDKYINGCQTYDEALLKAVALYGKIYTVKYNYIDPPILKLSDLKEFKNEIIAD